MTRKLVIKYTKSGYNTIYTKYLDIDDTTSVEDNLETWITDESARNGTLANITADLVEIQATYTAKRRWIAECTSSKPSQTSSTAATVEI